MREPGRFGSTESIYATSWNEELYQLVKFLSASRLRVIYTSVYDSIKNSGPFFGYYFFIVLLVMLQILHVYWFCLILRMLYSFLHKGQVWRPGTGSAPGTLPWPRAPHCSELWPHLFS